MDETKRTKLIYGLIDPRTKELRYVGLSITGMCRPKSHWTHKRQRDRHDRVHNWVRNILISGLLPEIYVIEQFSSEKTLESLKQDEIFWIGYFKMIGANLTNATKGGDGVQLFGPKNGMHGKKHSEESRKKISEAATGRICSLEWRTNVSRSLTGNTRRRGKSLSAETKKKISLAGKGRPKSDEWKRRMSILMRGNQNGRKKSQSSGIEKLSAQEP